MRSLFNLTKKLFHIILLAKGGSEMYNVLVVSSYIIKRCNELGYEISNLKLQKLLYFVQAIFLINKNVPCFKEAIEAWDLGPVVPVAYQAFKKYGSRSIPPVKYSYYIEDGKLWDAKKMHFEDNVIENNIDRLLIETVIKKFASRSSSELVSLTHNQKPWRETYQSHRNNVISIDKIKEYFK